MTPTPQIRTADTLFGIFEAKILQGELRDGDPLPPEREIVETYSVSRTVVREAILALASKGLIDAKPRHRPVVCAPSYDAAFGALGSIAARFMAQPQGVANLFGMRVLVETSLVREAALHANRTHMSQLRDALRANKDAIDDTEAFYKTDVAFHAVLFHVPGNDLLIAVHRAYTSWLESSWRKLHRGAAQNRDNYQAHERIFDAVLMRDPDAAEAAMKAHLDNAWHDIRMVFGPAD